MKAWIASHRLNTNDFDAFRRRWTSMQGRKGSMAYLVQSDDDPREILSITLCDDDDALRRQRAAAVSSDGRDTFADLGHEQWDRTFEVWEAPPAAARQGRRGRPWALLPLPLAAAAAAAFAVRQRQRQRPPVPVVVKAAGGRLPWFLLPAVAAPLGAACFFLGRWLGGMGRPAAAPVEQAVQPPERPVVVETFRAEAVAVSPDVAATSAAATSAGGRTAPSGLRVRDVMTPSPETIDFDEGLAAAAEKMRRLDVGILPVLADGQVAGVVTDRDLAMAISEGVDGLANLTIGNVMSSVPVTVDAGATVEEAAELMASNQIRRLLVTEGDEMVGIVSLGDLAVEGAEVEAQSALEEISSPAEPQR